MKVDAVVVFITILGCIIWYGPEVHGWMIRSMKPFQRYQFLSKFLAGRVSSSKTSYPCHKCVVGLTLRPTKTTITITTIASSAPSSITALKFRQSDTTEFQLPDFLKNKIPTSATAKVSVQQQQKNKHSKNKSPIEKKETPVATIVQLPESSSIEKSAVQLVDDTPLLEGYYDEKDPKYIKMLKLRRDASLLKMLSVGAAPAGAAIGYAAVPSKRPLYKVAGAAVGGTAGLFLRHSIEKRIYEKEYTADVIDSQIQPILEFPAYINNTIDAIKRTLTAQRLIDYDLVTFEKIARENEVPENKLSLLFPCILAEAVNQIVDQSMDITDIVDILDFIKRLRFQYEEVANAMFLVGEHIVDRMTLHEDGYTMMYDEQTLAGMSLYVFLVQKAMGGFQGYFGKRLKVFTGMFLEEHIQEGITVLSKAAFESAIDSILQSPEEYSREDVEELKSFFTVPLHLSLFREEDMQKCIADEIKSNIHQQIAKHQQVLDDSKKMSLNKVSQDDTADEAEEEETEGEDDDKMFDYYDKSAQYIKQVRKDVSVTFKINNMSKITGACLKVLDINDREMNSLIEQETISYYQQACNDIVTRLMQNPNHSEELAEELIERRHSLGILSSRTAKSCYLRAIRQKINKNYLNQINKVYKQSLEAERETMKGTDSDNNEDSTILRDQTNLDQVFKIMLSYVNVFEGLREIMEIAFPSSSNVDSTVVTSSNNVSHSVETPLGAYKSMKKDLIAELNSESDIPLPSTVPFPQLPFTQEMRSALLEYKISLEKAEQEEERSLKRAQMQGNVINTRRLQQLKRNKIRYVVDDMFQLPPSFCNMMRKVMEVPKVTVLLDQIVKARAFHEHSKQSMYKVMKEYDVKEEDWQATALEYYFHEVERIAKEKAIPTLDDMKFLKELRQFLDLESSVNSASTNASAASVTSNKLNKKIKNRIKDIHVEFFGEKYSKALQESMSLQAGRGGIPIEYHDGLKRLRDRLELTDDDGIYLLSVVMKKEILPGMINNLVDLMKMDQDPSYRFQKQQEEMKLKKAKEAATKANKDASSSLLTPSIGFVTPKEDVASASDGGVDNEESKTLSSSHAPDAFMREVINLIDSVIDNYRSQGLDLTHSSSSTHALDLLPIRISDLSEPETLINLFKHFLLKRLMETDNNVRKRYQERELFFAKLIGLEGEEIDKVKKAVAFETYSSIVRHALQTKEHIGQDELQQFAILASQLPLSEEVAEYVFDEANGEAIFKHAEGLLKGEGVAKLTPPGARKFRKQIESMGLDWIEDLHFTPSMVGSLFALEIQYMVEHDLAEEFVDAQEIYRIDPETASGIVELVCKRYVSQIVAVALRFARQCKEEETVKWTEPIIKFGKYFSGSISADAALYKEDDKQRLINYYLHNLERKFYAEAEAAEVAGTYDEEQFSPEVLADMMSSVSGKLNEAIYLDPKFVPSEYGVSGLLGDGTPTLSEMEGDIQGSFALGKKGLG